MRVAADISVDFSPTAQFFCEDGWWHFGGAEGLSSACAVRPKLDKRDLPFVYIMVALESKERYKLRRPRGAKKFERVRVLLALVGRLVKIYVFLTTRFCRYQVTRNPQWSSATGVRSLKIITNAIKRSKLRNLISRLLLRRRGLSLLCVLFFSRTER